ncbi:unnamed protein product [Linum tenue]|uniref:PGR5-like protein 1A, chloroplastic n=1 Tax=Linum tenue TaxID=586396 RepID=A0AAV0Q2D8_9ROSI|nr:unnamed protein product [Linum tenue]
MATKLAFSLSSPRFSTAPISRPFISPCSSKVQPISGRRHACLRRRIFLVPVKATADQQGQVQEDDVVDSKILNYCSIENKDKKSLGEMEQDFLQALQSFYYEGKAIMSNEEFDNLKEELMWEGSSVVMLSADEQRFLEASMAYVAGNPILSDKEFDDLKLKLKVCTMMHYV